jgi:hypothetical protein
VATTYPASRMSPKWVRQTRKYVFTFLYATHFPPIVRYGLRGKSGAYGEGLILRIRGLAVTYRELIDLRMHRMSYGVWPK